MAKWYNCIYFEKCLQALRRSDYHTRTNGDGKFKHAKRYRRLSSHIGNPYLEALVLSNNFFSACVMLFVGIPIFCLPIHASSEESASVEIFSPVAKPFFPDPLRVEPLSTGHQLAEGPVWFMAENCLLFVDIPSNKVYQWRENKGISVYLFPSGQTGFAPSLANGVIGANGLAFDHDKSLVLC